MDLRKLALVGAIALAACQHGGKDRPVSQAPDTTSGSQGTASTGTTGEGEPVQSGTGGTPSDGTSSPAGTEEGAPAGGATAETTPSTDAYGQTGTGSTGSGTDATGSEGTAAGGSPSAHSDDRTITGTVKKVSKKSIDIQDATGQSKTLQLVPETLIEGGTGTAMQLMEGQQVRASYNRQGGKDTAVRIEAIPAGGSGTGSSTDPGSSGTGTMGEPADPGTSTTPGTDPSTDPGTGTGSGTTPDPTGNTPPDTTTPTTPPIQESPPATGTETR